MSSSGKPEDSIGYLLTRTVGSEYAMPSPNTVQLPAHLLPASDVNVPAASQEPVGILQEGQVPFRGISLLALRLSPLTDHGGPLRSPVSLSETRRVPASYRPMIYLSAWLDRRALSQTP